jgi:hypothetical protein
VILLLLVLLVVVLLSFSGLLLFLRVEATRPGFLTSLCLSS